MEFKEGDYIQLVGKYIQISKFKKKLDYKNFKPFKVIKVINTQLYQLKLLENQKIYNVFHVSLLKKYILDIVTRRQQPMLYFIDISELK